MTINEVGELSTALLINLGMFVMGVYLVYVMFGAFNMSRKKETDTKAINKYLLRRPLSYSRFQHLYYLYAAGHS